MGVTVLNGNLSDPHEGIPASGPLILVVDDDRMNIRVLVDAIRGEYEVAFAADGRTALRIAKEQMPHLILLDIMMPEMDGIEVCRILKADPFLHDIPVIFLTALTDEDAETRGLAAGAVDYIHKPFKIPLVRARIRTHLTIQGMMDRLIEVNSRLTETITELEAARKRLEEDADIQKNAHIQEELFSRVFSNTGEGIIITDARSNIVAINAAFSRISGYLQEEVVGKNARFLQSGLHAPSFYYDMWQTLKANGVWRGELFSRRRNGETYPELRTISAVYDAEGSVTHYVSVVSDVTGIRKSQERIDYLTWHDAVTGLPNRLLFLDRLDLALKSCERTHQYSVAVVVEIDDFSKYVSAEGHHFGDSLLNEVARRIGAILSKDDTLARLGSNEFAIIIAARSADRTLAGHAALSLANAICELAQLPVEIGDLSISPHIYLGAAVFPQTANERAPRVLQNAQTACNRANQHNARPLVFFDEAMGNAARRRFALELDLSHAIARGELELYVQTQVAASGQIFGIEALARWNHSREGMIAPGIFIPIAEESRLVNQIDRWILSNSLDLVANIISQGRRLRISVNVSPRHFAEPDFEAFLFGELARTGVPTHLLTLEVTESIMISDVRDTIEKMRSIGARGIHFALDDFGSGYSSLKYLQMLPIHELKIDRSFVQAAPSTPSDDLIIEMIDGIARVLGIRIVAEGVETETHAKFLSRYAVPPENSSKGC